MSNLRNPEIRTRDIRKIVNNKSNDIVWDKGYDLTSEWVFASLETKAHREKLVSWLISKNISENNEVLLVKPDWKEPKIIHWSKIISKPESYFCKHEFELYDLDLKWLMEYKTQEIIRFGNYGNNSNA